MDKHLVWNDASRNGTSLRDFLNVENVDEAIMALETAADMKGEWEMNDFGAWDWWGLTGTFGGEVFTVYTHKSGRLKIGGGEGLDVVGVRKALEAIVG